MPNQIDEAQRIQLFRTARKAFNDGAFIALEVARDTNGRVTGIFPVNPDDLAPSSDPTRPGFIQFLDGNAVQFFEPEELIIAPTGVSK